MTRIQVRGADMRGDDMRGADMRSANLTGANMRDADMGNADMGNADMSNANMREAHMRNADMRNTDMRNADMRNANLTGVTNGGVRVLAILTLREDYTFFVCADGLIRAGCRAMTPADYRRHVHAQPHVRPHDKLTLAMIAAAEAIYATTCPQPCPIG